MGCTHATLANHEAVNHSAKEYVRGEVRTNTIEAYFDLFKRGFNGTYQHCQHCAEKRLHRYLTEFEFRYNNRARLIFDDNNRTEGVLSCILGKRLTYRQPVSV